MKTSFSRVRGSMKGETSLKKGQNHQGTIFFSKQVLAKGKDKTEFGRTGFSEKKKRELGNGS